MSEEQGKTGLSKGTVLLTAIAAIVGFFCLWPLPVIPLTIAFGWPWYLARVLGSVHPDPGTVLLAVACLLSVFFGGHALLRWVYAASAWEGETRLWPWRWTVRMVGLVLLMFVAGIGVTGLVHQTIWLVNSPEPIILEGGVRTALPRSQSMNNLKQMVVAMDNEAEADPMQRLPQSTFDTFGRPLHSWQTRLLPCLEQTDVFQKIDLKTAWNEPRNAAAMATLVKVYLNPQVSVSHVEGRAASHYAGNAQVVLSDRPKSLDPNKGDFPQGISNTILAGEVNSHFRAWGDPLNARDPRSGSFSGPNRPPVFVMLDGSIRTFNAKELAELFDKVPE